MPLDTPQPSSHPPLTALSGYGEAQAQFSRERLWALFDGDRDRLNITHECLLRHPPQQEAVHVVGADGRDECHTFGELAAGAARCAHWLAAQGVAPGERVAIMLEPSWAFYVALFGTMQAGAVAVPLFTLFGPEGLRLRLEDCTPRLLLIEPTLAERAADSRGVQVVPVGPDFARILADYPQHYEARTAADDLALFQYTSGTTRELPEAVRHTHRAVVTVAIAALYGTGVRPGDRFFCPASPAWGQGLWHGTVAPLGLGVRITAWAGPFDAVHLLRVLQEDRITNLAAAATHYRMLKNTGRAGEFRYHLRKMSFTGEPIDDATLAFAEATFGIPLCSMYGTTEVGVILANYPGAPDFTVKPGALGKPVPGVAVAVLDSADRPCAAGIIGEIKVRRRDGWFPTKDLGHVDEDGYFYHDGRADDVIISAGWTLSPKEIENVLLSHPDVDECAVVGTPDAERGQIVKAFIVSTRPGDAAFTVELQRFVQQRLSRHEYPRAVAYPEALPKTPAGKVNRKALRDRERAQGGAAPP